MTSATLVHVTTSDPTEPGDADPAPRTEPAPVDYSSAYAAYLDQGRWLLDQQQRRGATFQTAAITLIGFDGVLLALLVGAEVSGGATTPDAASWAARVGAVLIACSALAGLGAILPLPTLTIGAKGTVEAWAAFLAGGGYNREAQHFAHMLLALDAKEEPRTGRLTAATSRWHERRQRKGPPVQVLYAAQRLATLRGRFVTSAAVLLALGLVALVVVVFAVPPSP